MKVREQSAEQELRLHIKKAKLMTAGIKATLRIDNNDNVLVDSVWLLHLATNHKET